MVIEQTDFTPRQVAKMLGLGKQTVLDYIHRGELLAWNSSNDPSRSRFRVPNESIERFKKLRAVRSKPFRNDKARALRA